ncbi:hypothetical protein ADU59_03045 [Pararhizobium polonicum]|uniref:Uncharacterized protein n=1 Tax=Pararhizobium polonicum TaxID=1612624 RepID=A0A1C7P634_9HYPH|nr:hypothetical protein ADU59_03045 [Pararhizobium polonicum]
MSLGGCDRCSNAWRIVDGYPPIKAVSIRKPTIKYGDGKIRSNSLLRRHCHRESSTDGTSYRIKRDDARSFSQDPQEREIQDVVQPVTRCDNREESQPARLALTVQIKANFERPHKFRKGQDNFAVSHLVWIVEHDFHGNGIAPFKT